MTHPMPERNRDLHGSVPETSPVALLLIDVINDLEFDGADALLEYALPMANRIAALKADIRPSESLDLDWLLSPAPTGAGLRGG